MSKKKKKKKKQQQAAASSPPPAVAAASVEASPSGREKLEQKIERLEQKLEDKKRAAFESTPGEDDASIPPVVEDEFFKQGEAPPRVSAGMSGSFDAIPPDPRSQQKLSPQARARRAALSKWVKGAVAVSAAIIAIAALRVSFKHREDPNAPVKAAAAVIAPPVVEKKEEPVVQPVATQEQAPPVVDENKVDEKKDEPKEEAKVDEKKDEPKEEVKDEPKEKPALTAAQEKAQATRMLDANNAAGAAQAAARSVALDPHDAEAWLILGAAYQMQGSNGAAKQAFSNCTKQAKRGPVSECASMMNQ